jgi:hypothetical protein
MPNAGVGLIYHLHKTWVSLGDHVLGLAQTDDGEHLAHHLIDHRRGCAAKRSWGRGRRRPRLFNPSRS